MADRKSAGPGAKDGRDYTVRGVPLPLVPDLPAQDDPSARADTPPGDAEHWWRADSPAPTDSASRPSSPRATSVDSNGPASVPRWLAGQGTVAHDLRDPASPAGRRARALGWIVVGVVLLLVALTLVALFHMI